MTFSVYLRLHGTCFEAHRRLLRLPCQYASHTDRLSQQRSQLTWAETDSGGEQSLCYEGVVGGFGGCPQTVESANSNIAISTDKKEAFVKLSLSSHELNQIRMSLVPKLEMARKPLLSQA